MSSRKTFPNNESMEFVLESIMLEQGWSREEALRRAVKLLAVALEAKKKDMHLAVLDQDRMPQVKIIGV